MSSCKFTYNGVVEDFEVNDKIYKIAVEATATGYYDPGRMYMPNGDPGYPPEEGFDIDDVKSTWYEVDEDGNETEVKADKDMNDELWDYLEHNSDLFESDEPDYEEPDYDD